MEPGRAGMRRGAVIFDLDGTLLDTLADLAAAYNAVFQRLGFPAHPVDAYRHFIGAGIVTSVQRALSGRHVDEAVVLRAVGDIREEYSKRWPLGTRPFGGVPELLDELSREGVPMSVLSSKPDDTTRLMVARLLPDRPFAVVMGAGEGCPEKPDPSGALKIARSMGVAPGECAFVGDSGVDMLTARNAGMFGIGVLWGFRDEAELRDSGAHVVVEKPNEILDYLQ